jgi:hypothetical protein
MTMTDEQLEALLREHYARRSDVRPSAALGARVAAIPVTTRAGAGARVERLVLPIAAAVLVALTALAVRLAIVGGPGSAPAPTTPPAPEVGPPLIDGAGIVRVDPVILPLTVAAIVVVALVAFAWRPGRAARVRRLVAIGGSVSVGLAVFALATSEPIDWRDGEFVGGTAVARTDPPTEHDQRPTQVLGLAPGEAFAFSVTLTNTAPVPVTIRGLLDTHAVGARLVAAGLPARGEDGAIDLARPGAPLPVTVGAGDRVDVLVMGRADECVTTPTTPGSETMVVFDGLYLVYDVLGWGRSSYVQLPVNVAVPLVEGCSPPG